MLLILTAVALLYVEGKEWFVPAVSKVIGSVAEAVLATGTFGILFEYLRKVSLIKEVVDRAIGQSESVTLGIGAFTDDVTEIDDRHSIITSQKMSVSSRYSALFLENNRQAVYKRLSKSKLPLRFLRMKDASAVPHSRAPEKGPDEFFRTLEAYEADVLSKVELWETSVSLAYNFVEYDDGIWVKLYLNERSMEPPPAFFVLKGSPLYKKYKSDIALMFERATKVEVSVAN